MPSSSYKSLVFHISFDGTKQTAQNGRRGAAVPLFFGLGGAVQFLWCFALKPAHTTSYSINRTIRQFPWLWFATHKPLKKSWNTLQLCLVWPLSADKCFLSTANWHVHHLWDGWVAHDILSNLFCVVGHAPLVITQQQEWYLCFLSSLQRGAVSNFIQIEPQQQLY